MSVANEGLPEEALEDVQAARAVLATCGKLTGPVFDAVARWFMHVDLPTPIPVLAMALEQRVVLEAQVLDDTLSAKSVGDGWRCRARTSARVMMSAFADFGVTSA